MRVRAHASCALGSAYEINAPAMHAGNSSQSRNLPALQNGRSRILREQSVPLVCFLVLNFRSWFQCGRSLSPTSLLRNSASSYWLRIAFASSSVIGRIGSHLGHAKVATPVSLLSVSFLPSSRSRSPASSSIHSSRFLILSASAQAWIPHANEPHQNAPTKPCMREPPFWKRPSAPPAIAPPKKLFRGPSNPFLASLDALWPTT